MTMSGCTIVMSFEYLVFVPILGDVSYLIFFNGFFWSSLEMMMLEVHMRYLDSIHIARNDLKRDRAIMHNYKKFLTMSEAQQDYEQ